MDTEQFQQLRKAVGLSPEEVAFLCDREGSQTGENQLEILTKFDAIIETAIIGEVDLYTSRAERQTILIRFMSADDFALYEPVLFEQLKFPSAHSKMIARAKLAIERIGGEVTVAFMDSGFYETWLGVNDFDDSRDLRISRARQQIRGLSN